MISPKFILISGHAGSGKDTTADLISAELTAKEYSVLKIHYADLLKYICTKFFNWNGKKDEKGRTLLQTVGTDLVRSKNENFWVDFVLDCVKLFNMWNYVIIPDVRFPNEIGRVKLKGYDVLHIRVNRESNILTDKQRLHESETALDNIKPDIVINNDSTKEELKNRITEIISKI